MGGERLSAGTPLGFSTGEASDAAETAALQRELRQVFRPEFLNRLDEIVFYKPLTRENITSIIDLQMKDLEPPDWQISSFPAS